MCWIVLCIVGAGCCYGAYKLYKYLTTEKKPPKEDEDTKPETFKCSNDDLNESVKNDCPNPHSENTNLRQRKVHRNASESKENATSESKENVINGLVSQIESLKSENAILRNRQATSPSPPTLKKPQVRVVDVKDDVSTDSAETPYSALNESTDSENGDEPKVANRIILTYGEMSAQDRSTLECRSCENLCDTITSPCDHPFLCLKCIKKYYDPNPFIRCPSCNGDMQGYSKMLEVS